MIRAPPAASASAAARPIPREAPVTRAVFPVMLGMIAYLVSTGLASCDQSGSASGFSAIGGENLPGHDRRMIGRKEDRGLGISIGSPRRPSGTPFLIAAFLSAVSVKRVSMP